MWYNNILIFICKGELYYARGVRKSPTEKLQQQLLNTKEEIATHKSAIKTLEEKEKQLLDELKMEELKEFSHFY